LAFLALTKKGFPIYSVHACFVYNNMEDKCRDVAMNGDVMLSISCHFSSEKYIIWFLSVCADLGGQPYLFS